MCGITGWVSFERDLTREEPVLAAMTATMAVRGPDASGIWLREHVGLGHHRLAVIDPEGGAQPMVAGTPDGEVALTYSGEVHNFRELRAELAGRGHRFRGHCDTEVVLRGYLEWGEGVVDRLNGMFAFALWDGRDERLLLVRDRLGIKPLHYHRTADGVLFGSEAKALLAHPGVEAAIDLDGLNEMFTFGRSPGHAMWSTMREVKPATIVTVDRRGMRERTYWRLTAAPHTDDLETTVRTIRELLEDIVAHQLVADVPRCVLLSGGLDSSVLTGMAARQLAADGEVLRTFSVEYAGQDQHQAAQDRMPPADAPYARDVATLAGTDHHVVALAHAAVADPAVRAACVAGRDTAAGLGDVDQSLLLLYRAVREQSIVVLSGEAADELFGGYPQFNPRLPDAGVYPWLILRRINPTGMLDADLVATLDNETYLRDRYAEALAEVPELAGESPVDRRMRAICHLHLSRLLPVFLERGDRISMAAPVESRLPFCDHRLVEYVYNIPWAMKSFDGREKSLLRAACADVLPQSVVERRKLGGYPSTFDTRYLALIQAQVRDVLDGGGPALEFYDRRQVTAAVDADPATLDWQQRTGMERLLDLAAWLDQRNPKLTLSR
ncbi:MAG: asparagine synthase (glutamine-hydrolyzing) [Mycobacteriales bacterium]